MRFHPLRHIFAIHKVTNKSSSSTSQFWKHVVRREEKATSGCASLSQAGSSQQGKFTSDLFSSSPPPPSPQSSPTSSFLKHLFQHGGVSTIQTHLPLPTYGCPKGHEKQRCLSSPLAGLSTSIHFSFASWCSKHPAGGTLHLMRVFKFVWTLNRLHVYFLSEVSAYLHIGGQMLIISLFPGSGIEAKCSPRLPCISQSGGTKKWLLNTHRQLNIRKCKRMKNLSNSIFLYCFLKEQQCQQQIWGGCAGNLHHETCSLFLGFALEISAVIQPDSATTFLSKASDTKTRAQFTAMLDGQSHLGQVTMARGESWGLWGDGHNACPHYITANMCCSEHCGLVEKTQDFSTALQRATSKKKNPQLHAQQLGAQGWKCGTATVLSAAAHHDMLVLHLLAELISFTVSEMKRKTILVIH